MQQNYKAFLLSEVRAKNYVDNWCIKINRVKKFLKGLGQNIKGHNRKYKRLLQGELGKLEELEEENGLIANLLSRTAFIQGELMKLLDEEES